MKIAILLSGRLTSYDKHYQNIIDNLVQENDVDFYAGISEEPINKKLLDGFLKLYKPIAWKYSDKPLLDIDFSKVKSGKNLAPIKKNVMYMWRNRDAVKELLQNDYDWIISTRIDIFYKNKLDYTDLDSNAINIPFGSDYAGYQDKIAIAKKPIILQYLDVYHNLKKYLVDEKRTIEPETLIKYHLKNKSINVKRCHLHHQIFPKVSLKNKISSTNKMRVIVINAYEERREKYDERYEMYNAVWWENVSEEEVERYHFRHNAKVELRKKVVACSLSHKRLLQKIIDEDLKNIVIIEDDALIDDFDRLEELKDTDQFCYIGGDITSPFLKDMKKFKEEGEKEEVRFCCQKGINVINPKTFKIGQTCGYFIPNKEVCQMILSNLPHGKKERAIDNEYIHLQKKGKINLFMYPAVSTLYLKDACNGFTYSNYKLYDDQTLY